MNVIKSRPAAVSAAIVAVLNALVLLNVLELSGEQISSINIAAAAVLGLFVHQSVTPVGNVVAFRSQGRAVAGPAIKSVPNGDPVEVGRAA